MIINKKAEKIQKQHIGKRLISPIKGHIIGVDLNPDSKKCVLIATEDIISKSYNFHTAKAKAGSYFRGLSKDIVNTMYPKGFAWIYVHQHKDGTLSTGGDIDS